METTKAAPSPTLSDSLRSLPPAERLKLLRELVMLCFADGSLDQPLRVTKDGDPLREYVLAMFPRTRTPLPDLTPEEETEIRRRIANRQNAMSEDEFLAAVRQRVRERAGNAGS